jgi:preprotein translocase subunit SecA
MYKKLAGMTGTAKTEEDEFRDIYNMDVIEIPTNMPIARIDMEDSIYGVERGKYSAIVNKIVECNEKGQPVLVGTISIEKSEIISSLLKRRGVKHNVLNAKQHEREAEIIAEAGRFGKVTIATNMAGRGTDIILGGNPDFEAKTEMRRQEFDENTISYASSLIPVENPDLMKARDIYKELYGKFNKERQEEKEKVIQAGGLYIIGTERHESRRIDNQLRGRAGRQGDIGSTQFFISLEDELMRLFGGDRIQGVVERLGLKEGEPIEAGMLSKTIENAQKKVEGRNFSIRKYVLQYDNVMNKQREIIYDERKRVLHGEDLRTHVMSMLEELVDENIDFCTASSRYPEEWDLDGLFISLRRICGELQPLRHESLDHLDKESLREDVLELFEEAYQKKELEIGVERMRELERMLLIRVVDNKWMDHIDAMDQLRHGIGLRALGQQDPAVAYQNEGFEMFELMIKNIKEDLVRFCFNLTINTDTQRKQVMGNGVSVKVNVVDEAEFNDEDNSQGNAVRSDSPGKKEPVKKDDNVVGRNDPCPCGSGLKYKKCCGK